MMTTRDIAIMIGLAAAGFAVAFAVVLLIAARCCGVV